MTEEMTLTRLPKWAVPAAAVAGLLLVILFALGILGGGSKIEPGNSSTRGQMLPAEAKVITVERQTEDNPLPWQGIVRSRLAVKIAPKLNARIIEIPVHPGDPVKKGDILAKLDDRDLRAAYNAANSALAASQAQAVQAETEAKRIGNLYEKEAATRQSYDAVSAQAKAARALVNQAASAAKQSQVMLGENILYAPFDGKIGERLQEPGDMGVPNQPILTLLKTGDLRLEAAIASHCAAGISMGMPVTVRVDAIHQVFTGKVDEIAPEVDPQTRTQAVKISLPAAPGLQHGQLGWLELACQGEQQVVLIPASAVVHYGQLEAVKVADGKLVHIRHIRTGKRYGEQVEVLSGLKPGEKIVADTGLPL